MRRRAEGCGRPCGRRNDVLAVVAEDRRAGHEFAAGCVNQSFNCSVFASSATIARLAITGRLARADRRNESAVG